MAELPEPEKEVTPPLLPHLYLLVLVCTGDQT